MKKFIVNIIIMFLNVLLISAQELPKIVPPSPDVASLGKYGEIPIGYQYGTPNINIPIASVKNRTLGVDVSLSYRSEGVKVTESSSNVGMNWTLNAGGVITRQIRGIADEYNSDRKGFLHTKDVNLFTTLDYIDLYKGKIDGESDIFYYNFNGQSGKFVINKQGNAIPIPFRKIKINIPSSIIPGNPDYWEIITEDGTVYRFGENSKVEINHIEPTCSKPATPSYITGWMLTTMKSFTGEQVNYEYQAVQQGFYAGISETKNIIPSVSANEIHLPKYTSCPNIVSSQAQILTKISSDVFTIDFTYSVKKDMLSGGKKLSSIKVLDKTSSSNLVKEFKLKYFYTEDTNTICYANLNSTFHNAHKKRLYLEEVNQKKGAENISLYKFEYNKPELLPSRCSKSQDHRGFYNEEDNNSLIPKHSLYVEGGNREPSQNNDIHSYGVLKSITYPTKGKTIFEFEPNYKYGEIEEPVSKNVSAKYGSIYPSNSFQENTLILNKGEYKGFIEYNAYLKIDCSSFNPEASARIEIYKNNTLFKVISETDSGSYKVSGVLSASNDDYKFVAKIEGFPRSNCNYQARIDVNYNKIKLGNKNLGGLRIKSIENFDGNSLTQKREFTYHKFNNNEQSIILPNGPLPHKYYIDKYFFPTKINTIGEMLNCLTAYGYTQATSNSYKNLSNGSFLYYTNVTEKFSNGSYNEYEYDYHQDYKTTTTLGKRTSFDFRRGRLIAKRSFNATKKKVFESTTRYKSNDNYFSNTPFLNSISIENLDFYSKIIFAEISTCPGYYGEYIQNYFEYDKFRVLATWDFIDQKIETKYDINGLNPITTITNYFYDNPTHGQQTRVTTTNSKGEVLKTETQYAHDVNNQRLINEHRITEPINNKTFNGAIKLNEQQTVYKDYNGLYFPEKVQVSKGGNLLEDRIIYHSYDDKGNPTEVSKADGTHVVYIWGYEKTQPIAKIENARLSDIPTSIITSIQNTSNLDVNITSENTLRTSLNALRGMLALSKAQITTFTYNPLVGVTSITDPRGQTMYYEYDNFNRLKFIKNNEGKLLKETTYNYKN